MLWAYVRVGVKVGFRFRAFITVRVRVWDLVRT